MAGKAASLIKKETDERRTSNFESILPVKSLSVEDPYEFLGVLRALC
jgi:hypothetical protein